HSTPTRRSSDRKRRRAEQPDVRLTRESAPGLLLRLVPIGFAVGLAAGFFGIGGGFLIVPGLIAATAMPLSVAVGTSLVVVGVLGFTTAASYAISGFVDWQLTALLVAGGRSEEHTSELQSRENLVCRLLLEK